MAQSLSYLSRDYQRYILIQMSTCETICLTLWYIKLKAMKRFADLQLDVSFPELLTHLSQLKLFPSDPLSPSKFLILRVILRKK